MLLHQISDAVPQPVSAADLYFTSTLYNSRSISFSYAVGWHKLGFCSYGNDQCSSTGRESVDTTCDCLTNRLVRRQYYWKLQTEKCAFIANNASYLSIEVLKFQRWLAVSYKNRLIKTGFEKPKYISVFDIY
jgi:hypothetical protein